MSTTSNHGSSRNALVKPGRRRAKGKRHHRPTIPGRWLKLFALIPNYDPVATAAAGDRFDWRVAEEKIEYIETCLTHIEGEKAGQPFILEDWQKAVIGCIFGWKRSDGTRRYRKVFIYIPRKNGKTPTTAAITATVFFTDEEEGQQDFGAAADKDQATALYRYLKGMIANEPELAKRCAIYDSQNNRSIVSGNSFFRVLSADADTKHGGTPHLVIVDELHAQPNRDLVDVLSTSMASANRKQPLEIYLTTADYDRVSICNELYDEACMVRDSEHSDPSFLPVIFELKPDEDWSDPNLWKKANPNLGVSVSLDYMQRACARAKLLPSYRNTFRRLHLNQRTPQDEIWIPLELWDACAFPIDLEALKGRKCFAGLDLSSTQDTTAFVLVFPPDTSEGPVQIHNLADENSEEGDVDENRKLFSADPRRRWIVLPTFWIPADNIRDRERDHRLPYTSWIQEGYLHKTAGRTVDYDQVRRDINKLGEVYQIAEIAYDRWAATQIQKQLAGDGFEMIPFGQGYFSMSAPSKAWETLIISGGLAHGAHPILRSMAGATAIERDSSDNIKPCKKKSKRKIDGIVAGIMGLGRAMAAPEHKESIYNRRAAAKRAAAVTVQSPTDGEASPAMATEPAPLRKLSIYSKRAHQKKETRENRS